MRLGFFIDKNLGQTFHLKMALANLVTQVASYQPPRASQAIAHNKMYGCAESQRGHAGRTRNRCSSLMSIISIN
jgi:hypothetical protein